MQTLLVADDDSLVRVTVRRMAEDMGFVVRTVASGPLAVEACRAEWVDIAVIDVIMPGGDGISTMSEIRRLKPELPLVLISGGGRTGNADLLRLAEDAGADAVLRKPFERRDLAEAIETAETKARRRVLGR